MSTARRLRRLPNERLTSQDISKRRTSRSLPGEQALATPHIFLPSSSQPLEDHDWLLRFKRRGSYFDEAANTAVLRGAATGVADEVFVNFAGAEVQIALKSAGVMLASGPWRWQATAGGQALSAHGAWSKVHWKHEKECIYLEIELPLLGEWKLKRQILLARQDRFVLLADAFIGPVAPAVEIRCAHALPLAQDVAFAAQRETRDGQLVAGTRRRAVVVPPALAEWRAEFCHAELAMSDSRLTLHQASLGKCAYAPLWIDLDPRRALRPLTWRRLTVGENLTSMPRDAAAAYRIQAGHQQWLIYRSLAPQGNRSVLGYNTFAKFACARILPGAKTEDMLTIE